MRQSVSHAGSFFLAEMWRMVSSLKPGGVDSDSTSVTKPYLYSCLTRLSMVSVAVLIVENYFFFAQSAQMPWMVTSCRSALKPRGTTTHGSSCGKSTS